MAHFFSSSTLVCNKHIALNPIKIHTPSSTVLQSMHKADLDLLGLPLVACHGHIVLQLASQPLLSIGQLCDARCNIAFTADQITIHHHNNLILDNGQQPPNYGNLTPNQLHNLHTWPMPPLTAPHPLIWSCLPMLLFSAPPYPYLPKHYNMTISPNLLVIPSNNYDSILHNQLPCSKDTWIRNNATRAPPSQNRPQPAISTVAMMAPSCFHHWMVPRSILLCGHA